MPVIHEVNRPHYFAFDQNQKVSFVIVLRRRIMHELFQNYGTSPDESFISKCLRAGSSFDKVTDFPWGAASLEFLWAYKAVMGD